MDTKTNEMSGTENNGTDILEFLAFTLEGKEYGIDIRKVQELRGYDMLSRPTEMPDLLKGVINLRGVTVPVINMRAELDVGNSAYDLFTIVVIVKTQDGLVGMVVDSVLDVVAFSKDQLKKPPAEDKSLGLDYLIGEVLVAERTLTLVDIEKLMAQMSVISPELVIS